MSSLFPDLRYAGALWSADAFKAIVIDGALQDNGMVSFKKDLTTQDADAIRAYVVQHWQYVAKNAPPLPPSDRVGRAVRAGAGDRCSGGQRLPRRHRRCISKLRHGLQCGPMSGHRR